MPLHYMQAFKIPVGVMKHIDRMRRSFLWKGKEVCKGIDCLVNWDRVCAPKENGGLGIINLACQNDALLAKWIWQLEGGQQRLWTKTMLSLHGITAAAHLRQRGTEGSFLLKDLIPIIPFCSVSTETTGGTGGAKTWKWTASGAFSCASAYHMMHNSGIISPIYKRLWKIKVPMKVRIFVWLMLDNKILTQQVLTTRGCTVQTGCHLCSEDRRETRTHIMWGCTYATRFWVGMQAQHNIQPTGASNTLELWIKTGVPMTRTQRGRWDVIWAAGA